MLQRTPSLPSLVLSALLLGGPLCAQAAEPVDKQANDLLRRQGLEHSQVAEILSWICDVHGPRLTGSPNLRRAQQWALSRFEEWGLKNAHLEDWGPFGRGWRLDHFNMEVLGENPWPVHAWPKAWSPGIEGRVEAEVVFVGGKSAEEIEAMDLRGKIVLREAPRKLSEPFEATAKRRDAEDLLAQANASPGQGRRRFGRRFSRAEFRRRFQRRGAVMRQIQSQHPLAIGDRSSKGDYGTIFVSGASVAAPADAPRGSRPRPWSKGVEVIPQFTLAAEHYNRICRLLQKKVPVRLGLELRTTFFDDDPMQHNVIAEIPGTDPRIGEELVMLGAHFDSWHAGTGATDNGAGSAVMMEVMRLLQGLVAEVGHGPRRTIRVALWSGEEQGLLGSRAYVGQHFAESAGRGRPPTAFKPEHALLSGYFNLDNGTGRIRGVFLQRNRAVAPIFRAWLQPFKDLGASTLSLNTTGGTDHLSFDAVGLPGFQFIQDPISYGTRTHHSNMDSWDHAIEDDLKQAATIIASFVWHTAQRDQKLPRKPLPSANAVEAAGRRR